MSIVQYEPAAHSGQENAHFPWIYTIHKVYDSLIEVNDIRYFKDKPILAEISQ